VHKKVKNTEGTDEQGTYNDTIKDEAREFAAKLIIITI